jgi:hypothetical protein
MMDLKARESAASRHQTQLTVITTLQSPFQIFRQEMSFQFNLKARYWLLNSHNVRQIVKFYQSINQYRVPSPVGSKVGNHKVIITSRFSSDNGAYQPPVENHDKLCCLVNFLYFPFLRASFDCYFTHSNFTC